MRPVTTLGPLKNKDNFATSTHNRSERHGILMATRYGPYYRYAKFFVCTGWTFRQMSTGKASGNAYGIVYSSSRTHPATTTPPYTSREPHHASTEPIAVGHGKILKAKPERKELSAAYAASETKRSLAQATPQTSQVKFPAADRDMAAGVQPSCRHQAYRRIDVRMTRVHPSVSVRQWLCAW